MNDYDKLRELARNATDGEWHVSKTGAEDGYRAVIAVWHEDEMHITDDGVPDYDAEYIAAANPQTILNLLEDLRITRAERDAEKKTVLAYRKSLAQAIIELGKKDTK